MNLVLDWVWSRVTNCSNHFHSDYLGVSLMFYLNSGILATATFRTRSGTRILAWQHSRRDSRDKFQRGWRSWRRTGRCRLTENTISWWIPRASISPYNQQCTDKLLWEEWEMVLRTEFTSFFSTIKFHFGKHLTNKLRHHPHIDIAWRGQFGENICYHHQMLCFVHLNFNNTIAWQEKWLPALLICF